MELATSLENVGAFAPMGSIINKKYLNFLKQIWKKKQKEPVGSVAKSLTLKHFIFP